MADHQLLVRIAEALGVAPKLAALVDETTIVEQAAYVRRERDEARAEILRLGGERTWASPLDWVG